MRALTLVSGKTVDVPEHVDMDELIGVDSEGRFVVQQDWMDGRHAFGLTLCCAAFDKGTSDGTACRACYDTSDIGAYYSPGVRESWADLGIDVKAPASMV